MSERDGSPAANADSASNSPGKKGRSRCCFPTRALKLKPEGSQGGVKKIEAEGAGAIAEAETKAESEAEEECRKKLRASGTEEDLDAGNSTLLMKNPQFKVSAGRLVPEDGRAKSEACTVFLWDLDETLIIFNSLKKGTYGKLYGEAKDPELGALLGRCWEKLIFRVCDSYFFFEEVEEFCEPNISSLIEYDDGADLSGYNFGADGFKVPSDAVSLRKFAYRHRWVSHLYSQGLARLLAEEELAEWNRLYEATDKYTDGWLSAGRALLADCLKVHEGNRDGRNDKAVAVDQNGLPRTEKTRRSRSVNVLVTSGVLIPSIVKCLLFKLDPFIECDKIYSSRVVDKLACFRGIKERYSHPATRFCVIGDGMEECEAAERLRWPFLRVEAGPEGVNRLPALTVGTVQLYMRVVYDEDDPDDEVGIVCGEVDTGFV